MAFPCQCEIYETCPACMSDKLCNCQEYEACSICIAEFQERYGEASKKETEAGSGTI